ncbi:S26 family signal peptidase [Aquamicrobium terrae]|uniref:Conjugative transfer signal peptidase TraF n=1 Tax=Aquamicrobium terrae TaxID=1324945 RepID=A0ABV2MW22_9HYPH
MSPRSITLLAMLAGAALVATPVVTGHAPRFIWNASPSVPIGLYEIAPADAVDVGDLVAVLPPDDLAAFLAARGYLPRGVPLIKRVLALPGSEVCRRGLTIIAYDHAYGDARPRDRFGRDLPQWQGCRTIADGEIFLMNWDAPDSLDGRYFGALPASTVIGRVLPLYTDEYGDGRFRWRFTDPALEP